MSTRQSDHPGPKLTARQPTELDRKIGALIRERRLSLAMRQEDLARVLGITPHQLKKYEVGENRIAASRLVECARALGVPVVWFYNSGAIGKRQIMHAEARMTADENELIRIYRSLSMEGRVQLVAIAKVMVSSATAAKGRSRQAVSPK